MSSSARPTERLVYTRLYLLPALLLLSCTIFGLSLAYAGKPAISTNTSSALASASSALASTSSTFTNRNGRLSNTRTSPFDSPAHLLLFERGPLVGPAINPDVNTNVTTKSSTGSTSGAYSMPVVYAMVIPVVSVLFGIVELAIFWSAAGTAKKTTMTTVTSRRGSFFFAGALAMEWTAIAGIWTACEIARSTDSICPAQLDAYGILTARRGMAIGKDMLAWIIAVLFAAYATIFLLSLGRDLGFAQQVAEVAEDAPAPAPAAAATVAWHARSEEYKSMARTEPDLEFDKANEHSFMTVSLDDEGGLRCGQKFSRWSTALEAARAAI